MDAGPSTRPCRPPGVEVRGSARGRQLHTSRQRHLLHGSLAEPESLGAKGGHTSGSGTTRSL
eukprot:10645925-Alexandrium_andersonii.AAC.1